MKILLTGGSGFLGRYLIKTAPDGVVLVATSFRNEPPATDENKGQISAVNLDLTDQGAVASVLAATKPDYILHAAADADAASCEANPTLSRKINTEVAATFAAFSNETGAGLCYLSTDLVFDGKHAPYNVDAKTNPLNTYGRQKVAGEIASQKSERTLICRLPLMYGLHVNRKRGQLEYLLQKWLAGESTPLFTDEYRTIGHVEAVAAGIWQLIQKNAEGIFHLGGPERISRYDFGRLWAETCSQFQGQDFRQFIEAKTQGEISLGAERPADVSLDSSLSYAAGFAHQGHSEILGEIARELLSQ